MVDVYMHDEYMEGRKDDLGSTVSATCNSRQSASNTQVQHNVTLRKKAVCCPTPSSSGSPCGLMASPASLLCSGDGMGMEAGRGRESISPPGPTLRLPLSNPNTIF